MRWSAVFAGTAVAIGIWALLEVLGMGAGLAALGGHQSRLHSIGIGTTVWSLVVPVIAMFFGGWIAGKLAGSFDGKLGALHGAVVWALTSALGIFVVVSFISALVTGSTDTGAVYDAGTPAGAGKALLVAGGSMLLSLGTGLLGGRIGVRMPKREDTTVVVPPAGVDTAGY